MQQIGHRPNFGRSLVGLDRAADRERTRPSAAVVRRASARQALEGAHVETITRGQHVARWSITVVAIVLASALYALQIQATLH